MSIIKKLFGGLFSSEAPSPKEVDLLDLAQQNLDKVKAEAKALRDVETKAKEEELKLLERAAKLASIDRELESTFDYMAKGHKRVKKIEKRILAQKNEEQELMKAHFDKARELRAKFEASLWEDDEEECQAPPARRWKAEARAPQPILETSLPWICPHCNHVNPAEKANCEACYQFPTPPAPAPAPVVESDAPEEPDVRLATEKKTLKPRGTNPNVSSIPPVNLG